MEQARSFHYFNFSRRLKLRTLSVINVSPTAKSFLDCQRTKRNDVSQQEFPGMTLLLMVQEDKSMREPVYFCNIVADIYTNVA